MIDSSALFNVFRRQPVTFVKGEGAYLWDDAGKKYLDFFSGLAVTGLGHAHPAIAAAVAEQARTLLHTSNIYFTLPQLNLAKELSARAFGKVFFTNEGGETFVLKAGRTFELLHVNRIDEPVLASPAMVDGTWYFRTPFHLMAVGK